MPTLVMLGGRKSNSVIILETGSLGECLSAEEMLSSLSCGRL